MNDPINFILGALIAAAIGSAAMAIGVGERDRAVRDAAAAKCPTGTTPVLAYEDHSPVLCAIGVRP
jgi:hypothetical protein